MTKRQRHKPPAKQAAPAPSSPEVVGGSAATTARLKSLAGDLLSVLELAVRRQDMQALLALVGKSQNIIPALNTVTRLVQLLDEKDVQAEATEAAANEPFNMTAADCDLMVRYCIKRMAELKERQPDSNLLAQAWEGWLQATQRWREHDV